MPWWIRLLLKPGQKRWDAYYDGYIADMLKDGPPTHKVLEVKEYSA